MKIGKDSVVSMRYIMRNGKNEVLENTMKGTPVSYLHGSAGILHLLQSQLYGLKKGDKKIVCLPAASGPADEDFTFEVTIDEVRAALPEEVMLGYPVQHDVEKCEPGCACYDEVL